MSDRDWEVMIGRLIIYRKGWRWTVMWRSGEGTDGTCSVTWAMAWVGS